MFALPYIFGAISRLRNRLLHSSVVSSIAQKSSHRPPNILIYTGQNDQNSEEFQKTKELLKQCLHQDKYVIYQLKHELVLQEPWKESTELLVLTADHILDKSHAELFASYVKDGGKLLGFSKFFTLNDTVKLCDVSSSIKEISFSEKFEYGQCLHVPGINAIYKGILIIIKKVLLLFFSSCFLLPLPLSSKYLKLEFYIIIGGVSQSVESSVVLKIQFIFFFCS